MDVGTIYDVRIKKIAEVVGSEVVAKTIKSIDIIIEDNEDYGILFPLSHDNGGMEGIAIQVPNSSRLFVFIGTDDNGSMAGILSDEVLSSQIVSKKKFEDISKEDQNQVFDMIAKVSKHMSRKTPEGGAITNLEDLLDKLSEGHNCDICSVPEDEREACKEKIFGNDAEDTGIDGT